MSLLLITWLALCAGSVGSAQTIIKDRGRHTRPLDLSAMVYLSPFHYGLGFGVVGRIEIPIVPDGFIPPINDQFSLEPSLGIGYRSWDHWRGGWRGRDGFYEDEVHYFDITPAVYGMWSFHITPRFRPYGALGFGANFGAWTNEDEYPPNYDPPGQHFFYADPVVGLFFNFSEYVWMRAEIGYGGPKIGLAFVL